MAFLTYLVGIMKKSLINFQFYKTFRMKVFEKDKIFVKVTALDGDLRGQVFEEFIQIQEVNLHSISLTSPHYFQTNDRVRLTIFNKKFFNKWELDVEGTVVRAFTGQVDKNIINYGIKLDKQEEESELKYFLKDFVHGFSTARLKKYLIQSALSEKSVTASDGVELYSLLSSIYTEKLDLDTQVILDFATNHLQADFAKLYIINTETDKLETTHVSGATEKTTIDFRESYAGQVFTSKNTINLLISENSEKNSEDLKTILAAPVFNKNNQTIGVLEVSNHLHGRFTQDDEKVISFLSHIVASNFENHCPISKNTAVTQFNPTLKENFLYLGQSKNANFVSSTFQKLQNTNENIYIVGEKGLGKGFIAKSLHMNGMHALKELKILNCKESELVQSSINENFENLNLEEEGTLILKCIEHLKINEQEMLFHQLKHTKKRIISTGAIDLESLVKIGEFHEGFYNTLNKAYIHLKPLRNRTKDIISIANYFLEVECEKRNIPKAFFNDSTNCKLLQYNWPGNIEEVERLVKKALMKMNLSNSERQMVVLEIPTEVSEHNLPKDDLFSIVNNIVDHSDESIPLSENIKLINQVLNRGKKAS